MNSKSSSEDIMRPLTAVELEKLLLLYKNNYSKTSYHYISIYTQCKWNQQLKEINESEKDSKWKPFRKSFYTHRNGNLSNGTYVSLHWDMILSVQFFSLEQSLDELKECLLETKLINWKSGPLVTGVLLEHSKVVEDILRQVGATIERARECHCLILQPEMSLELEPELPEGYTLRHLEPCDAELVHSTWTNKREGSLDYIRGLTLLNKALGIVRLNDNALVGWIFQNDFCGLGILFVVPEEQGKGFGKFLGVRMSKEIARQERIDITAFIVRGNTRSEGLLNKIGFRCSRKTLWIQCQTL